MPKPEYISASQINTFLFCPLSYYYNYLAGLEKAPPNIYMIYGTAIHEALAHNYTQKITTKTDLDTTEVFDKFIEVFEREIKKHSIKEHAIRLRTMTDEGRINLQHYMKDIAPNIQPTHVEEKIKVKLKHFPITLLCIIDLITDDDIIIDHKTAGRTTLKNWTQKKVDEDLQFTLYSAAFRKFFQRKEQGIRVDVIPRGGTRTKTFDSQRTDDKILKLLETAARIEQIIDLGVFNANIQNCGRCPYKKTCPKQPLLTKYL